MRNFSKEHAYGACHALTAALLSYRPSGEAKGLFIGEDCLHSIFRVPHSDILVDAFGAEAGPDALKAKTNRYRQLGERMEWRTLSEHDVRRMVSGDKARALRRARPVAMELLRDADEIEASQEVAQQRPPLPTPQVSPALSR